MKHASLKNMHRSGETLTTSCRYLMGFGELRNPNGTWHVEWRKGQAEL